MKEVTLLGSVVVFLDIVLTSTLWALLVLLECSGCGGLTGIWLFAVLKWVVLHVFTSVLTDESTTGALHRFVALVSLLPAVFESGRFLKAPAYVEPCPNLSALVTGPLSSVLACAVWENGFSGEREVKKENRNLDAKQLVVRVLKYFKPDSLYLLAGFGFLILGVICDSYIPLYEGKLIDIMSSRGHQDSFGHAVGYLALFVIGSALFSGLRGGIFMCSLAKLNKRLKDLLFDSLLQQEMHFFEKNRPGQLSSRLHSDVDRMGRTVALNANVAVRSTVKGCLMLRLMLGLSWELTLLTCIEMPLLAMLQKKYESVRKELKEQMQDCHAEIKGLALETFGGIRVVRSFRAEAEEVRRYHTCLERLCSIKRQLGIYGSIYTLSRRVVTLGIKLLMLTQARSLISSGHLSVGSLVTFFLYQKPMSVNLREIMFCYGETMSVAGVISTVLSYIDRIPQWRRGGSLCPEALQGSVVFQNVSFRYPSAPPDQLALKSISFELQPGKITGLVGLSGNGKSTCVGLLKRLYEPQDGQILLDGQPLHLYEHKYLHQKIALVSQNPVLLSGSLRDNIEFGLKGCTKTESVAESLDARGFISEMENGFDTDVGESGKKLSEGQRQIVAIIRALVRDPQVVILDEATSNLDVKAQHAVLKEVTSGRRTVLIVTHQLNILESADHIIFLERGSVVEEGTHDELMEKRGRYYRLKKELFH